MVDLAEIQAAYYMVAATGVLVAAVFYILNLRMVQKKMKVDTAILYGNLIYSKDRVHEWRHFFLDTDFTSYEDWVKRYRPDPEEFKNFYTVVGTMNTLGMLMKEKVVDSKMFLRLISPIWIKHMWVRAMPVIKGLRDAYNCPEFESYAEHFFKEAERMYPEVKLPADRLRLNTAQ